MTTPEVQIEGVSAELSKALLELRDLGQKIQQAHSLELRSIVIGLDMYGSANQNVDTVAGFWICPRENKKPVLDAIHGSLEIVSKMMIDIVDEAQQANLQMRQQSFELANHLLALDKKVQAGGATNVTN